jgi:hypothetical protein
VVEERRASLDAGAHRELVLAPQQEWQVEDDGEPVGFALSSSAADLPCRQRHLFQGGAAAVAMCRLGRRARTVSRLRSAVSGS